MTVEEVAEFLKVSDKTERRLVRRGEFGRGNDFERIRAEREATRTELARTVRKKRARKARS